MKLSYEPYTVTRVLQGVGKTYDRLRHGVYYYDQNERCRQVMAASTTNVRPVK